MQEYPPLIDSYNRRVTSLRISVTQRCNLNCIYCHHEGEVIYAHAHSEISRDTITALVRAALAHGVEKIKFTGGEPLCRSDFVDIVSELPALKEVSVTTNGTLLSKYAYDLAEAGLRRVNVSLDTLRPDRYQRITGGNSNALDLVLGGVCAAVDAGLTPVKLNMVLLSGINDDEIWDLVDFARSNRDVILQIIELMDSTGICENVDMGAVEDALRARASEIITRRMHRRRKYMIDGAEVELVRPIDNSLLAHLRGAPSAPWQAAVQARRAASHHRLIPLQHASSGATDSPDR